jgi:uridine kinase
MQGWYFWILPFLIYFYIKQDNAPRWSFLALNILYFAYFFVIPRSDYFQVFQFIIPSFAEMPNLYQMFSAGGYPADVITSVIFSLLQSVLILNVFWIYLKGIESNMQYKIHYKPYLIGIAGDSGSGKSTLTSLISDVFGRDEVAVVEGDDMHKWERGDEQWKVFTHLNPKANEVHENLSHAMRLKRGDAVYRRHYDHHDGHFTLPQKLESKKIIIFDGLHSLLLNKMRDILDLKIFMRPEENLRIHWKVIRDVNERGNKKEQIIEQIHFREEDAEKYIRVQEEYSDISIHLFSEDDLGDRTGDESVPINIAVEFQCANDINFDPLFSVLLAETDIIEVGHVFEKDRQFITLRGPVDGKTIDRAAYLAMPELWNVIIGDPQWSNGYKGLIQLLICYYIFEKIRINSYEQQ